MNPLVSVAITKVAKVLNPGEGLLRWANSVGLEGKTLEQARGSGRSSGSSVHQVMEALAGRRAMPRKGELSAAARPYAVELYRWWTGNDVQAHSVEVEVASQVHRFHGRMDYARWCRAPGCHCFGEGVVLGDVKTGASSPFPEHLVQLTGYRVAWPESGYDPRHVCGTEVLCLPKGGEPAVAYPNTLPDAAFLHALALWRFVDAQRDGREMDDDEAALVSSFAGARSVLT